MKNDAVNVNDIAGAICDAVPLSLQEEWDNSGLSIGFGERTVSRILTCLEIDKDVIAEAERLSCEMIVTHHPLIFSGIKSINEGKYEDDMIIELIDRRISVFSCHTPFDKITGGNNDELARRLGLTDIRNLAQEIPADPAAMAERCSVYDIGRIGSLKGEITLYEAVELISEALDIDPARIRAAGDPQKKIRKIGMCTGAGAEFAGAAASAGCDLFITGDVKHHEAIDAKALGIAIIDAGHYGTEKTFAVNMKRLLDEKLGGTVQVIASEVSTDPFI